MEHIATFCGNCNCGCPELFLDHDAPEEKRVVITDDFGQRVQMSTAQWEVMVADIKSGTVDGLLTPTT